MNSQNILHILRLLILILVGLVVIGTFIDLTIQNRTKSDLTSNLEKAQKALSSYKEKYGTYPHILASDNCPIEPISDSDYCLNISTGITFDYQANESSSDYTLYAAKSKAVSFITSNGGVVGTELQSPCPVGYIPVPGSAKYGTSDFCAMKFEAKCATADNTTEALSAPMNRDGTYENWTVYCNKQSSRKMVSTASGPPVALITFDQAVNYSKDLCYGCHLMTEAEWQTIAENILKVPDNYISKILGKGEIFSGHTDSEPNMAIVASENDNEGYYDTGTYKDTTQRRTLKLTNGQIIWDFNGNVWEWTQAQNIDTLQFGLPSYAQSITPMWYNAYTIGSILGDVAPNGVGLSSQSDWLVNHNKGLWPFITDESKIRGFTRGGFWGTDRCEGMKLPYLSNAPSGPYTGIGLRVSIQE